MRWSAGSGASSPPDDPEGGQDMKRLRALGCIAAATAALTIAAGPATADDTLKLTIGQRGNWDTAITQLGTKAGIFKQHGIELEMIYTSGSGETLDRKS